jgi:cation transport regulator ChaC
MSGLFYSYPSGFPFLFVTHFIPRAYGSWHKSHQAILAYRSIGILGANREYLSEKTQKNSKSGVKRNKGDSVDAKL